MEAFFATVPDAHKLRDAAGRVIPDTAIIPDFVSWEQAEAATRRRR
jgi:hypothetical protein